MSERSELIDGLLFIRPGLRGMVLRHIADGDAEQLQGGKHRPALGRCATACYAHVISSLGAVFLTIPSVAAPSLRHVHENAP